LTRGGGSGSGSSRASSGENRAASRGATGSVRGRSSALRVADKAKPGWHRPIKGREPDDRKAERRSGVVCERPKLEARRQARAQPGSDCRKVVRRRTKATFPSRETDAVCGQCSASCALGNRTVHGCSCRESIAEVGEKHLLRVTRGEPRGKPRWHGVARSGRLSLNGMERNASGERVRGLSRERNRDREGLRSIARSRSNRRKAPWAQVRRSL